MEGQEACASLQDAISVVEFLATFGAQCGIDPLGLHDLHAAAAWPLHTPGLVQLYTALLRCILQDQASTCSMVLCSKSYGQILDGLVLMIPLLELQDLHAAAAWPLLSPGLVQLYTILLRCILQDQVGSAASPGISRYKQAFGAVSVSHPGACAAVHGPATLNFSRVRRVSAGCPTTPALFMGAILWISTDGLSSSCCDCLTPALLRARAAVYCSSALHFPRPGESLQLDLDVPAVRRVCR